ncbi:MAG: 4-hydroxy-tetrahydrodipicolinate reductase [Bilifractor sp.]|jgi:4-hydroxy-tetrahydrodipicolinate reductase|nr:4-hydroxy-tetrahydrodipicolinate reductase [Lachnospiraceae bacterium]MDY2837757.1 4-hydroxy-tetrahydrodipicolinate reductase [Bilifractor sp.]
MIKVILSGCNGHMGQVLTDILNADSETVVVAGIDIAPANNVREYPIFTHPSDCNVEADAVIDFSNFRATDALLDFCVERRLPLVLCTTALTEDTLAKVQECSKTIPILRSANMSVGINLLMKLVKEAAALLAPAGYDMEIVEAHHNRKIDAPSGTALALGESMNEALDKEYHFVFSRHDRHEKRDPKEIGISSVRGGSIVGDHTVMFAGQDEVIEFRHTAYSRAIFGKGAVEAAKFLAGKPAGMYDMSDVIG